MTFEKFEYISLQKRSLTCQIISAKNYCRTDDLINFDLEDSRTKLPIFFEYGDINNIMKDIMPLFETLIKGNLYVLLERRRIYAERSTRNVKSYTISDENCYYYAILYMDYEAHLMLK